MRTADEWFDAYGESHQNPTNKLIHWVCVPTIVFSLLGMLWGVQIPGLTQLLGVYGNLATLVLVGGIIFYLMISPSLAVGMLLFSSAMMFGVATLQSLNLGPLWLICLSIFVFAWVGQFIGHKIEGKKPSFFEDLQFLMIGPMWLLGFIYRRLGIPY